MQDVAEAAPPEDTRIYDPMHHAASTGVSAELTLSGVPASVSAAGRLIREAVRGCPRADDLILAVSELASNAVAWSASGRGGTFTVRVRTAPRWARAEITDDGAAADLRAPGNGWGLAVVSGVTDRSGSVIRPDGCRTAWAEVTWTDNGSA
jgi:anti-sigma regulatory factor (Ser/Thr protein kinase)